MEENTNSKPIETIPYIVHESEVARLERTIKRLFILCMTLLIVAVATNIYWIWNEMQYEEIVATVTQDVDAGDSGNASILDGVHINGTSTANSDS